MVQDHCYTYNGVRVPTNRQTFWTCRHCRRIVCSLCQFDQFEANDLCKQCFLRRVLRYVVAQIHCLEKKIHCWILPPNSLYTRFINNPFSLSSGELRFLICNNFLRISKPINDALNGHSQRMQNSQDVPTAIPRHNRSRRR
jgi:hypothetical protein